MAPSRRPALMKICPLFPHLLSSTYHAIVLCTTEITLRHSGWGNDVLFVWKHEVHVLEWLLHPELGWACNAPIQHLRFPLQPDWRVLPQLARLNHYIFNLFQFGILGGAEEWAGSIRSLT
jgi:hypothetical protein